MVIPDKSATIIQGVPNMKRSRKVVVLCHCLLNANVKVHPLATHAGALGLIVSEFAAKGVGLFQLPCPETSFLGLRRWGMTSEQYDHPAFRRHCREILGSSLDQLEALYRDDCRLVGVVGVDGSPSCGVFTTCTGYRGGEISSKSTDLRAQVENLSSSSRQGIFIQEFLGMLKDRGIPIPLWAVDENAPDNLKTS